MLSWLKKICIFLTILVAVTALVGSFTSLTKAQAPVEEQTGCTLCHTDIKISSVHQGVACNQCHLDFSFFSPYEGQLDDFRTIAGVACKNCHVESSRDYHKSTHGSMALSGAAKGGARCSQCHGAHNISSLKDSPKSREAFRATAGDVCGRCHQDYLANYNDYYHGKAYKMGASDAPPCWDCHGQHAITPAKEPSSKVSEENIVKTCGKCHEGSSESFAQFAELIHGREKVLKENPLFRIAVVSWLRDKIVSLPEYLRSLKETSLDFLFPNQKAKNNKKTKQTGLIIPVASSGNTNIAMSKCVAARCHSDDINDFDNPILIFNHYKHLERGFPCELCHQMPPHSPGERTTEIEETKKPRKPSMTLCYSCHGLYHGQKGLIASGDCNLCHLPGFKRLPGTHTQEFVTKSHKNLTSKDAFTCQTCHSTGYCITCHQVKEVRPENHRPKLGATKTWQTTHGKKRQLENCKFCHDKNFCLECHKTTMPHDVRWLRDHRELNKLVAEQCSLCHEVKEDCSKCHHPFKMSTLLQAEYCVRCHPEYERKLDELVAEPKGIRSRGIMIHRAHFETPEGKPYQCVACHTEEVIVETKELLEYKFCEKCHGAFRRGKPIAKLSGQKLCDRCHENK